MAARSRRSSMRGRPPCLPSQYFGRSGSTRSHNSSGIRQSRCSIARFGIVPTLTRGCPIQINRREMRQRVMGWALGAARSAAQVRNPAGPGRRSTEKPAPNGVFSCSEPRARAQPLVSRSLPTQARKNVASATRPHTVTIESSSSTENEPRGDEASKDTTANQADSPSSRSALPRSSATRASGLPSVTIRTFAMVAAKW
jgi:hypothetical protein